MRPLDVEHVARRWLASQTLDSVARILAYVPFLVTPPAIALVMVAFASKSHAVLRPRYAATTALIAISNVILSIAVIIAFRTALMDFAQAYFSGFGAFLDHLIRDRDDGTVVI